MSFFASQWQRGAAALLSVNTLRFGAAQAPGRRMMLVAAASVAGVTGRRGAACGRAMVGLMRSAPSAPMCSSQLAGKVRYMGIMDSFQQALDTRKEDQISKKKSELFSAQITFISGLDEFQMKDHVTMVQVGGRTLLSVCLSVCLSGWSSWLCVFNCVVTHTCTVFANRISPPPWVSQAGSPRCGLLRLRKSCLKNTPSCSCRST